MTSPFPALAAPLPLAIAHRGGAWESPENSPAAFRHAYDLGFRYLETDARATRDGVALAFHDSHLGRVTGKDLKLGDVSWSTVRELRIHGHQEILRLEDLLRTYPDTVFNVDVKEQAAVEPFADALAAAGAVDRVVLASFSHRRLRRVRELVGPRLASSMSPREVLALRRISRGKRVRWRPEGLACAQVPESVGQRRLVDEAFVTTAHDLGLQVHVWTVDDAESMHRLLDLAVDGIMTDRPTVLRDVMVERGSWRGPGTAGP